jgi:hypothetical protein
VHYRQCARCLATGGNWSSSSSCLQHGVHRVSRTSSRYRLIKKPPLLNCILSHLNLPSLRIILALTSSPRELNSKFQKTNGRMDFVNIPSSSWSCDRQSIGLPSATDDQISLFCLRIVGFLMCGALSDDRTVYNSLYNCFWALPEQSLLGPSPAEITTIFYCLIWDVPNLKLKLKLIYDRQSVGQSVLVSGAHLGPVTNFSFSLKFPLDSCGFVILYHPLWGEDGSVIYLYNYFWALLEQPLLGRSPAELTAIFYCLIWDSPNLEGQVPVFISPRNRVTKLKPIINIDPSKCRNKGIK